MSSHDRSVRLEIISTPPLPTEPHRMIEYVLTRNDLREVVGNIVRYDHQQWLLQVDVGNDTLIKIKQVQTEPTDGDTLKVQQLKNGEYELLYVEKSEDKRAAP